MRFLLVLLILCAAITSFARTIEAGPPGIGLSLSDAIANSHDGDTIFILPGVYKEGNVIIDKRICLLGLEYPELDGEFRYEILSIKRDSVIIEGLKLSNSGNSSTIDYAAIKVYDSNYVVLKKNHVVNAFFGIYLQYARNCKIIDNEISSKGVRASQCGNGIHCWKCDSLQIIHNLVSNHRDGIYFEFVTNSIIWRNESLRNLRYGLHFMFSNHDHYVANIFENNGAGVAVMFSNHVSMHANYFADNWGDAAYGILLKEISDGKVEGNYFERNTTGIFMEGASRIDMNKNVFANNGWGLKIQASCMDIVLKNNEFLGNSFDVGTNGSLALNTFVNNYWDKYEGYDLDRNGIGDISYRPVSLYSMIVEKNPSAMMLFRSLITTVIDRTEKVVPSLIPENLVDNEPLMKRIL
jgi:nitrous oxidase accessory protein